MPKELIVIINSHRKLGELLLPYTIERIAGQSFFQLQELITTENLKTQKFESNELISQIIRTTSEYSDKSIHKVFSKKKNLKEFFDTLDDKLVTDQIRPYIEKRIDKCVELLLNSGILQALLLPKLPNHSDLYTFHLPVSLKDVS